MSTPTPPNDPRLDGDIVDDSLTNPTSPSNVPATVPEPDAAVSSTENVPAPKSEADQEKLRRQLKAQDKKVSSSIATGAWAAIIVGAIALIVLLVFIVQNQQPVQLVFFNLSWEFPIGVGMLLAAILGALLMACIALIRMFQLRFQVSRQRRLVKKQEKLHKH